MNNSQRLIRSCYKDVNYIQDIEEFLPNENELIKLTCIFKALNDPIRVKILLALLKYEICVGEMVNLIKLPQAHVSHQLQVLKKYGVVGFTKDKQMSFYYIKNEYVKQILQIALNQIKNKV